MTNADELITVAQLLNRVPVTGEYWEIMLACKNSIVKIAEALKENENAVNNKPDA